MDIDDHCFDEKDEEWNGGRVTEMSIDVLIS